MMSVILAISLQQRKVQVTGKADSNSSFMASAHYPTSFADRTVDTSFDDNRQTSERMTTSCDTVIAFLGGAASYRRRIQGTLTTSGIVITFTYSAEHPSSENATCKSCRGLPVFRSRTSRGPISPETADEKHFNILPTRPFTLQVVPMIALKKRPSIIVRFRP